MLLATARTDVDGVGSAANRSVATCDHVLEVGLDERSLRVRGIDEGINERDEML